MSDESSVFGRRDRVIVQQVEGSRSYWTSTPAQYFSLNEVGGRVWDLCDGSHSVATMAEVLCDEYDVDATDCAEGRHRVAVQSHRGRAYCRALVPPSTRSTPTRSSPDWPRWRRRFPWSCGPACLVCSAGSTALVPASGRVPDDVLVPSTASGSTASSAGGILWSAPDV